VIDNIKVVLTSTTITPSYLVKRRQRICILAGPHKTGTSSIQGNLYRWSRSTINLTDSKFSPLPDPVIKWIWPVPIEIARIEHNDSHTWNWAPSKVFYPMMEVLMDKKRHPKKRNLFQMYTPNEIIAMYRDAILTYWNDGYDVVFGTEAMDMIVKLPEGPSMIRKISTLILPNMIDGDQITVVIMYRSPKVDHLVSMWHQNCDKPTDDKFYEWITSTKNTLGPMDSLGMVDMFLNETNWNVSLVNLEGLIEDDWDLSNFVACEILGEECEDKVLKGLHGSKPIVTNVRSGQRPPNVPNQTLVEMDAILNQFDCNYMHILRGDNPRLSIFYPQGLQHRLNSCLEIEDEYPKSRNAMTERIKKIALNSEKLW